ncbi:MAG: SDR family oxidoreductase [Elainella sp. C42_A2020_010]|nr:SDR family oxidoreductase [Elainella sp. C42_A2020_010]
MFFTNRFALVTGSSRGIGRAITLKLAEQGVQVAVHYYQNQAAAHDTLLQIQQRGADGFVVQADVSQPEAIDRLFSQVQDKFGKLDIFVSNARPDLPLFYQSPLEMSLDHWRAAIDSQAQAFLLSVQKIAAQY